MIELLIYIAISSIALLVFVNFMVATSANAAKSRVAQEIQQNARLALDSLSQEVRGAQTINASTVYSASPSTPGTLVLTYSGGNHTFSLSSGVLQLNSGAGPVNLTSSKTTVTQFEVLNRTPADSLSPIVTVNITVQSTGVTPAQSIQVSHTLSPHNSLYQ